MKRPFHYRFSGWQTLFGVGLLLAGIAQLSGQDSTTPAIPPRTPPPDERNVLLSVDGATLYQAHCAVCHGKDASGGGPAASSLKKRIPDLTRISRSNRGTFPLERVQLTISGEIVPSPAHGSREMPIWGPVFSQVEWDQDLGRVRIYNLAKYLESLQKK